MSSICSNPCTRCGKERVISKTYEEDIVTFLGTSKVTYTETVCPDSDCQKIVDEKLKAQKQKTQELKDEKQKKLEMQKALRAAAAAKKARQAMLHSKAN